MQVEMMPISVIKPYERNPRRNQSAIEKVAASISAFGWQQPIVVDRDFIIIVGHTRYQAALKLGFDSVPVSIATALTPEQVKAYRIADNKVGELAEWDNDLLKLEIDDLKGINFDLDLTGFESKEIQKIDISFGNDTLADTEPQIDHAAALQQRYQVAEGQLWQLGRHRILCGDSTIPDAVSRLLQNDHPQLMVTDPPYGVNYDAAWRNGIPQRSTDLATGKVLNDHRADWRETYALFPGDVAYIWHASSHTHTVAESLLATQFALRTLIIWRKNHFAISRGHYHHQHEPCWYAVKATGTAHWIGDRSQTTVWDIDKPLKSDTGHSTQKPLDCMANPIRNHDSEFVYDPFLGSGTTLIACENLGRSCLGIELNPAYAAVILQRYLDHTGIEPKRLD